jgi:hypothetical protein
VAADWSSPAKVEFKPASEVQGAVESKRTAAGIETKSAPVTAAVAAAPASAGYRADVGTGPAASVEVKSAPVMAFASVSPASGGASAGAAASVETKSAPEMASAAPAEAAKRLVLGQKQRTREKCTLDVVDSDRKLVLTNTEGHKLSFGIEWAGAAASDLPVDIIGDISGSMGSALAFDTERKNAVPRSVAHEAIYRAVRKMFPAGQNLIFDDTVRGWNMEGKIPSGGGTDLTTCMRSCRSSAITVIFTDDKGGVSAQDAFAEGRQKLVVPCLLTAFDIDVEYGDQSAAHSTTRQRGVNQRYRWQSRGQQHTDPRYAPGFGVAMMGQRDALSLIRVDTAYDATGNVSHQDVIVGRIAAAIEKARTAQFWRITNPTSSEFVIHCPSGRSVCILPGTHTTIAPDLSDLKGGSLSNVYIHSPKAR